MVGDAREGAVCVGWTWSEDVAVRWPLRSYLSLVALPNAAYWARRLVGEKLCGWELAPVAETVELVVSELVTNAVRASGVLSGAEAERYVQNPQGISFHDLLRVPFVRVRLSTDRVVVLVEVWDRSSEPPVRASLGENGLPDVGLEGGRGLFLVEECAHRWGWYYPAGSGSVRHKAKRPAGRHRAKNGQFAGGVGASSGEVEGSSKGSGVGGRVGGQGVVGAPVGVHGGIATGMGGSANGKLPTGKVVWAEVVV